MLRRILLFCLLVGFVIAPTLAGEVQPLSVNGGPVYANQDYQTDRRANELDEILWEEDFEAGDEDWIFIDANTQEVIYWQTSDWQPHDGDNWRCYNENIGAWGGYDNHWLQWMITPELNLTGAVWAELSFYFRLICEDPEGAQFPYDGWDAANVWASDDGGETWEVIEPLEGPEYNVTSAYSFGQEWRMGPDIPGWGGTHFTTWQQVVFDMSPYVGQNDIMVRFAFCSDPAACTADDQGDDTWTGFQIDDIVIAGPGNVIYFSDDADGNNVGGPLTFDSGLDVVVPPAWDIYTVPDAYSPTHVLGIEDIPLGFVHYMQYAEEIDLTEVTEGQTQLDVYLRGAWDHPNPFPDNAFWTVKVRPSDAETWYYATNPYALNPGTNYVFTDAPPTWARYSESYGNPWDLTPYHGLTIEIRVEFESPVDPFNPGDRYIQFDDFFVENTSYEHDVGTMNPRIPYPATVGRLNPAYVTFFNNGTNPENFVTIWYLAGRPITFNPPQITLQPNQTQDRWLDNNANDGLDGWVPTTAATTTIYTRAVLQNDENTDNNSSATISIDVCPAGEYEFGYVDRMPTHFYSGFLQGDGPMVHFTPVEDMAPDVFNSFNLHTLRVMWNGDIEEETNFDVYIFAGGDEPGVELYSDTYTVTPEETYPNYQNIDFVELEELSNLLEFWVRIELTDPAGFPHIVRASNYHVGAGHMFDYVDGVMTETTRDYFITVVGEEGEVVQPPQGHFIPVEPTGIPYAIIVNDATLDDETLVINDEIGIFDGDLCVGASIVDDWPLAMTAWGGDPQNQLPGYVIGNPILYRVWSDADQMEYTATATYLNGHGNGTFSFGAYSEITLEAISSLTLTHTFAARYFELISFYVVPPSLWAPAVFYNYPPLEIVYQDDGAIYIPPNINTIGNITLTEGYQVFCSAVSELITTGPLVAPDMTYRIFARRWNWIGYPFNYDLSIVTALASIQDHIVIVMTDDGRFYIPPVINTIGSMTGGEGYYIFVDQDVNLVYTPALLANAGTSTDVWEIPEVDSAPAATGLPYIVLVELADNLEALDPSTIELLDGSLLVGKSLVLDDRPFTPVVAWGGSIEHELPGFTVGHEIQIVMKNAEGLIIPTTASANASFGEGAYATITIDSGVIPSEFTVENGYPNPFNPTITIPFALPAAGNVGIAVFNVLGQKVYSLDRNFEAGTHRFIFDAKSVNQEMVSGVYFVQISYNGQVKTQKVMLLK